MVDTKKYNLLGLTSKALNGWPTRKITVTGQWYEIVRSEFTICQILTV